MKALFRQLLETALFNVSDGHNIVLVPQLEEISGTDEAALQHSDGFLIPDDLLPTNCRVFRLPLSEAFLKELPAMLPIDQPLRVFIIPPILSRKFLSDALRAKFPFMNLEEIALSRVVEIVAPGSQVGCLLPGAFLFSSSSRKTREHLSEVAAPRLIITHHQVDEVLGRKVFHQFWMGAVYLEKGAAGNDPVRFFKCPPVETDTQRKEILGDFKRLLKQGGGKTQYGYVLREGLLPDDPWLYDAHHPDLVKQKEDLAQLGSLQTLSDLVEIKRGILPQSNKELLVDATENRGVVLIEGRDIKADGTIEYEDPRYRALVPEENQLQPGDICVRAIQDSQSKLVCAIFGGEVAAAAGHSVIVMRPHTFLSDHDRQFLLAYLRSSVCAELLRSRGLGIHIVPSKLLELPVPIADEALHMAVRSLGEAAQQFRTWADELEAARGSLFDSDSARNARINALSMGRLAKQRYEAALLVSDFRQRVRTRFPYPVAFRWRTVESQHPTLEGYIQVLECAEVAITYLAIMALLLARSVNKPIRKLDEMAKRISTTGHGTNMGDWLSILLEVGGAQFADNIPDTAPFVEVSSFQNSQTVKRSLKSLADMRNDQAHGRGPKGAEIPAAFERAKNELSTLLQAVEFVTDYPLRYVETTRRDALQKVTRYDFRELMGDHALVPLTHEQTPDAEIEAQSLYLLDRTGMLHLLRPLLIGRECPVCYSWGTFFLDTRFKDGKGVVVKSMEHGHTSESIDLLEAFRASGLLV